ncbi:NAD-dependent epimerase/dehydratase family protein [Candidatus Altiarchaeota archaeon]
MRVLVTGGAGFIGSNIVDLLIASGHDVAVVDNLSTGKRENLDPSAEFHEVDITGDALDDVFAKVKPEAVIHEAAQINVRDSVENPAFDASVNVLGSINLLECLRRHDVGKIVYASSGGAVYGEPEQNPCDESHSINPLCPYGASKYAVEKYLFIYNVNYGIDYTILRYSNVYGPRQDPLGEAGVVAIFTNKMLAGQSPMIFGDGDQTRDFVYVGDVAQANLLALNAKTEDRIFNIGSGVESSVNDVTGHLLELTGSKANPEHGPEVKGEVRNICLDIGRARSQLAWDPKVGLGHGLKMTVEWAKSI